MRSVGTHGLIGLAAAAGLIGLSTPAATAHPHIFAEARLEVETTGDGRVSELRNVWRFDELFSSSVLLDFDDNKNLKLDRDELAAVGETVRGALADFDYYVSLSHDGTDVAIRPPEVIHVDYRDGQLLMLFAVEPAEPMALSGRLTFGVYDPTMYTALDFVRDADLVVTGESAARCERDVVRPDPDQVIADNQASLTEAFFSDPGGNDLSKLFATRLELTC